MASDLVQLNFSKFVNLGKCGLEVCNSQNTSPYKSHWKSPQTESKTASKMFSADFAYVTMVSNANNTKLCLCLFGTKKQNLNVAFCKHNLTLSYRCLSSSKMVSLRPASACDFPHALFFKIASSNNAMMLLITPCRNGCFQRLPAVLRIPLYRSRSGRVAWSRRVPPFSYSRKFSSKRLSACAQRTNRGMVAHAFLPRKQSFQTNSKPRGFGRTVAKSTWKQLLHAHRNPKPIEDDSAKPTTGWARSKNEKGSVGFLSTIFSCRWRTFLFIGLADGVWKTLHSSALVLSGSSCPPRRRRCSGIRAESCSAQLSRFAITHRLPFGEKLLMVELA